MTQHPHYRRVRVTTSCTREQVQEISFQAGDSLSVGHRNLQHPAFVWSATENGHHGWVPEEYIRILQGHDAVALRDYDSVHLTVMTGEILDVLEQVGDYLFCRNSAGVSGWIPESCVEDADDR